MHRTTNSSALKRLADADMQRGERFLRRKVIFVTAEEVPFTEFKAEIDSNRPDGRAVPYPETGSGPDPA